MSRRGRSRPVRARSSGRAAGGWGGRSTIWVLLLVVLVVAAGWGLASGAFTDAGDGESGAATTTADPPPVPLTFPEGLRREEMAARIAAETDLDAQAYLDATEPGPRGRRLAGAKAPRSLEGFLFPATYQIGMRTTVGDLVAAQIGAYQARRTAINYRYARSKNLTEYDVLIIASMIEREVRVDSERRKVAAVIYNRLRAGVPLGIDATVLYALGDWEAPLTASKLRIDSPYNTRRFRGLPPGPIANPGELSLRAAANPARTGLLYYVARDDGTGRHHFSTREEQFERDVQRSRESAEGR